MKKEYLIPVMEYLDVQTSIICEGSPVNETNPEKPGYPSPKPPFGGPRHL